MSLKRSVGSARTPLFPGRHWKGLPRRKRGERRHPQALAAPQKAIASIQATAATASIRSPQIQQVCLSASCSFADIFGVTRPSPVKTELQIAAVCLDKEGARLMKNLSPPSLLDEGLDKVEDAYEEDKQRGHNETVSIPDKGTMQHAQSAADGTSSSNGSSSSSSRSSSDGNGVSMRRDFCTGLCSGLPTVHCLRVSAAAPTQLHHARAGSI